MERLGVARPVDCGRSGAGCPWRRPYRLAVSPHERYTFLCSPPRSTQSAQRSLTAASPRVNEDVSERQLRLAAQAALERRSLRKVADEIGLSPNGLKKFLAGGSPHAATLGRLRRWYAHERLRHGSDDDGAREVVLSYLLQQVPAERREEAARRLPELLGAFVEEFGGQRPPWLERDQARGADAEGTG